MQNQRRRSNRRSRDRAISVLNAAALVIGGLAVAGAAVVADASAALADPPNCTTIGNVFADGTCNVPGVLGSGRAVSMHVEIKGAGAGGGDQTPYTAYGGAGAKIDFYASVPEGSTINYYVGLGGGHDDNFIGAGGGGSSALVDGATLLAEAGGGGGGTHSTDGGHGAFPGMAGQAGASACSGAGGNGDGHGGGGAAATAGASCTANSVTPSAGAPGGSAPNGVGGAGGSSNGTPGGGGTGGTGYHAGGDGGTTADSSNTGGGGGGGGYGGGGGGVYSGMPDGSDGAGGGGGSYVSTAYTAGAVLSSANNGGNEDDGGDGRVKFYSQLGPLAQTLQSVPTGLSDTGVTLHSLINADGTGATAQAGVRYSTDPTMGTGVVSASISPTSAADGAGDTNITGTLTGLKPCTTYYYQASASEDPFLTYGLVESFKTTGCPMPLTVHGRPARSKISAHGSTVVVRSAYTSAAGRIVTAVRCSVRTRGDLRLCSYRIGRNHKITITTFGRSGVRVTVTLRAVPRRGASGTPSQAWRRTWRVR